MIILLRNLKTEVVHKPECPAAGFHAAPWHWATTRTMQQVTDTTAEFPWVHLCRKCLRGLCHCERCGGTP